MAHRYNKWTDYEDNVLTQLVQKYGIGHWSTIARQMKNSYEISKRNGKQCRQRWFNQLDRSNVNRKWTEDEDLKLIRIQAILGTKWIEIAHSFPGRSDNNVKNHFYSIVRKSIRKMCRFVNIKTTLMKVYSIKPSTLSKIFVLAASESLEQSPEESGVFSLRLNSRFTIQDYCEITQFIHYFIFENQSTLEAAFVTKEKVLGALNALMEINDLFQKDSNEDINSHESYSGSAKKDSSQSKNESSGKDEQVVVPEIKEEMVSEEVSIIDKIEEEDDQNYGIFSFLSMKGRDYFQPQASNMTQSAKILPQIFEPKEQDTKISNLQLLRGASEISFGINFPEINWSEQMEEDDFELRLYVTPRTSGSENLFNRYYD